MTQWLQKLQEYRYISTHGNRENIKITTPEDLTVAHALISIMK
jgi:2-C-methyl-D-erythritol 4-phosphate cytidylyltransferase